MADKALLARPLLNSCYAAQFLAGHRPVLIHGPGVGDPALEDASYWGQVPPEYAWEPVA